MNENQDAMNFMGLLINIGLITCLIVISVIVIDWVKERRSK
jgi:hypothetical protein